jgi:hypothetical protein
MDNLDLILNKIHSSKPNENVYFNDQEKGALHLLLIELLWRRAEMSENEEATHD